MANMSSDHRSRADAKRLRLRAGLAGDTPVVAVGAHDAMSALLIGNYDFDAVWVSGFGVSAMAYGLPDLNLVTMSETLAVTRSIESVTDLPVVVDCDNGFGGFSNVVLTPHIGAMAVDSQRLIGDRIVELVQAYDNGKLDEEIRDGEHVL